MAIAAFKYQTVQAAIKILLSLVLTFQVFICLHGQEQYKFDQFVRISESNNEVRFQPRLAEGPNGFIWIPSDNGLCRFDGKQFKFYKNIPDDPQSIFSNQVRAVLPLDDEIWLGTTQGISVLNIHSEKFRNYQLGEQGKMDTITLGARKDVISLFQDRQGEIWVGTKFLGLWKYDAQKDDFIHFEADYQPDFASSDLQAKAINCIEQPFTNDSIIWAGTSAGLMEVNKFNGEVCFYSFPHETRTILTGLNTFRQLYFHQDSLLYAATWAGGLHIFDANKKKMILVQAENDPGGLLGANSVSHIIPKSTDELWVTTGSGLFLYSTRDNRIIDHFLNDAQSNAYYGIHLVDKDRRAWYSNFQGLHLYDPYIQQFHTYAFDPGQVRGNVALIFLQEYDAKNDQIVTCPRVTDGLYRFDRKARNWRPLKFKNLREFERTNPKLNIYGFDHLRGDEYVLGGVQGLFRIRLGDGMLVPVSRKKELKDIWWTSLLTDHEGKLWAGSMDAGLFHLDPETDQHEVFIKEFSNQNNVPVRVDDLFEDSQGNIWIKRNDGFSVYIRKEKRIRSFLYTLNPENSFTVVDAFAEDNQGRIWTCSEEGRLGYMEAAHPEKGIVRKFNIHDAGLEGQINGLASDPEGNIWGATSRDIFRINGEGEVVSHFSLKYSSIPIDLFGMKFLPDGQLVIGGREEITLTYPEKLKRNEETPEPYLTQITIRQKPLNKAFSIFGETPLNLSHNENFFSFSYASQAFTFPEDVRYRYRLQGLEDWVEAEDGLVANYTSVPPGDYTFQLMAANNEGSWNDKMLEVPVVISQAWFKSWWFLSLAGLFFALLVYSIFHYRIQQVKKEEKIKTAYERKLAGVEMSALVSQMNPHFLFNSLNSIDSYIIKNQSFEASEYLNKFAHLMRLILQNSRSNHISLQNELQGLELYLQMESMRSEGHFSYAIEIDPEVDIHKIEIPPMLIQPYVENAIWHGLRHLEPGKAGRVALGVTMLQEKLQITILDNGIGRVQSAELQKKKSGSHKRSMGMQITQNRIEMINKLYQADASVVINDLYDEQGDPAGTKVTLTIAI